MLKEMAIEDDAFLVREGHIFYVSDIDLVGPVDAALDTEHSSTCTILYGNVEKYTGPCAFKIKKDKSQNIWMVVLISNKNIGNSTETKRIIFDVPTEMVKKND
jgi:hypothetical protein